MVPEHKCLVTPVILNIHFYCAHLLIVSFYENRERHMSVTPEKRSSITFVVTDRKWTNLRRRSRTFDGFCIRSTKNKRNWKKRTKISNERFINWSPKKREDTGYIFYPFFIVFKRKLRGSPKGDLQRISKTVFLKTGRDSFGLPKPLL